jgi:uncharacterized protein
MSSTSMHPNERRIRDLYSAMSRGDVGAVWSMWAEDARMTIPGTSPLAGRYEGRQAIFEALGQALAQTDGNFSVELLGVLANDSYAVALHHWTAEREGRSAAANNLVAYRLNPDGLIVERIELLEDAAAHDEFWS